MQTIRGKEWGSYLSPHGRVYDEKETGIRWCNWSCAGVRCVFSGTWLHASLQGVPGKMFGRELPWMGVTVDEEEDLHSRFAAKEGNAGYCLLECPEGGIHTVDLWKLSENYRGQCGLLALETDGYFLPVPPGQVSGRLEFVGDSITCGFGNEAPGRDTPFLPEEENGYLAYGPLAARQLSAAWSCVSVSGITAAVNPEAAPAELDFGMLDIYSYTDRLGEMARGTDAGRRWDFAANPVDVVVVNLGTNDVNAYRTASSAGQAEAFFHQAYRQLLECLRRCNPHAYVLCTLGPMEYFLYDEIQTIVKEYRRDTGDSKISCFKFGPVRFQQEGLGAVGHPTAATHRRMAQELADHLRVLGLF